MTERLPHTLPHTVIIICGPTAVGKSAFAIQLAQSLGTEIISADSRQCYRELGIAVAKPNAEELAMVPHYFIDSHSIHEEVNAGVFEDYALQKTEQIFQTHPTAVMVGGTGLYIRAFCEGMDAMPAIDPEIRKEIITTYETLGLRWLQEEIATLDPAFWQQAEQSNPQRLMRALEIFRATGKSILHWRKDTKKIRPFRIIKVGLELPKELLDQRIRQRVDQMQQAGLVEEARALYPFKNNNALQTVGYQELFDYFDGKCNLEQALERICINTRQYAKRQMTWFRKDPEIHWFDARAISADLVLTMIDQSE